MGAQRRALYPIGRGLGLHWSAAGVEMQRLEFWAAVGAGRFKSASRGYSGRFAG
jgi:hypothetical protein